MPAADRVPDPVRRWLGPALVVVVAGGLLAAAAGAWRPGLLLVGATLLLTALLRACVDPLLLAPLAVRSRWLDVLFLLVAAGALLGPALALG